MHPIEQLARDGGFSVRSYSGRGMYGRKCLGIQLDRGKLFKFVEAMILYVAGRPDVADEIAHYLVKAQTDDLGHGSILYFDGLPAPDHEEGDGD